MTVWVDPAKCKYCSYCLGKLDDTHPSGNKLPRCEFLLPVRPLSYGPFSGKVKCPKRELLARVNQQEV